MKREIFGLDAFSPQEVAQRVETVGVVKARLPFLQTAMLGVLAGGFIGLGALVSVLVMSDATLGFAASRLLAGLAFSLGLVMVVVAGAELFTGNNLLAMAWADGRLGTGEVLRNWTVVAVANFAGAAGLALIVYGSQHPMMNDGAVADTYVAIAAAKCALPFWEAFLKGMLCNFLVCIAVWMAMAGRSLTDKVLAIVFPITAFVAAGFEHSIANMYLIPLAMLLAGTPVEGAELVTWAGFARNLAPVILGNLVGGSVLVAFVYHLIYRRGAARGPAGGL
jgi:formate transporter